MIFSEFIALEMPKIESFIGSFYAKFNCINKVLIRNSEQLEIQYGGSCTSVICMDSDTFSYLWI